MTARCTRLGNSISYSNVIDDLPSSTSVTSSPMARSAVMDIFYSLLESVTEIEATYEIRSRGYKFKHQHK